MIGKTLSHFKIDSKLGEGGMGEVWSAEDIDLHRPVALKVLAKETLAREDMRARFLREARTAAALNHPNICTIYEVGEVDDVPFIAMERIEGEGLDTRLASGSPLALGELVKIGEQIAAGLAAAHARGIVHRDLKPGNVMLTPAGEVKILDFGLAKPQEIVAGEDGDATLAQTITAEMTREGTILGTVSYMSPEQAQGKPVDSRSDVFSFGVLLYQMATGRLPFRGETSTSTLAKILESDPESPSVARQGLPPDLERIIRRCLDKRPANRYNDTRDLVADLRSLETTGESPVAAAKPGGRANLSPWIWSAAVAVVIVLGLVLWRPWTDQTDVAPVFESATSSAVPSVAVLPFHNLSADPESDYFSDGMTEEIISKLSRIDGLEVASRSSVAPFTDRARDVQQIGRDLGVRYLLDGSVRRAGDQVRVSAQLVDGETGRNLWSEDFDGTLEDVFAVQEQTALAIANKLDLELSPEEQRDVQKRSTENVAAYDAYLQGLARWRDWGSPGSLEQAVAFFERALELDPDYAEALAGVAGAESDIYRTLDSTQVHLERAEAFAQRAVEIEPSSPEASHALGLVAGNQYDYRRAAELFRKAAQLAPKEPIFWDNLSWALAYRTPPDGQGAVDAALQAIQLQPHYPAAYYHLGRGLLALGRNEEALVAFETMTEQDPDFGSQYLAMAQYYLSVGEYKQALASLEVELAKRDTVIVRYYRAAVLAAMDRSDEALEELARILEGGFRDFATLDASPWFDSLRDDPRFKELIAKYRK